MNAPINRVEAAFDQLRQGRMVILTDHADRENEGDLIFPAETITPEIVNFMRVHCSGIICLALQSEQIKRLGLEYMVPPSMNNSQRNTPFTVSIEAREGVSTGVSALDRTTTILAAMKEGAKAEDLVRPGHVFPLHAKPGGVLERQGHTEGSVDLVSLAGFKPAAVLCEVMNSDGTMAKGKELLAFAKEHQLQLLSIEDLRVYRLSKENLIADEAHANLPLDPHGAFEISVIKEKYSEHEHIILSRPPKDPSKPLLVRIHSSCITGDLFGSKRCDCAKQLQYALERLSEEGGLLIYLNQEGRGIGLFNKIKTYSLQEQGFDTVEANEHLGLPVDSRDYYLAASILRNRTVDAIRLMTNNPNKINSLKKYGLKSIEQIPMPIFCNLNNINYLTVKKEKLNHIINF